jgi:serine O-acetyltransferase
MTKPDSFCALVKADAARFLKPQTGLRKFKSLLHLVLFVPGFQLAFCIRLQSQAVKIPFIGKLLRKFIWYFGMVFSSADIAVECEIGAGIYMPHPTGIVVRPECLIGKNVTILQGVTIGKGENGETSQTIIGDNCKLYAGAKIIGDIRIGDNAVIGANAVVLKDIPAGATAVGVPARIIKRTVGEPAHHTAP